MALTLQPLARTTPCNGAELKAEARSLSASSLARRDGVTAPTVRKWRARDSVADRSDRPDTFHCALTPAQEVVATEFRRPGTAAG